LILDGLAHQSLRLGREPLGVDNLALRLLVEHTWPTNELELGAVLARAALLAKGPTIGVAELEAIGFHPESLQAEERTPVPAVVRRRTARRFPRG
jgi:DNA-binding NtrC family response regulator